MRFKSKIVCLNRFAPAGDYKVLFVREQNIPCRGVSVQVKNCFMFTIGGS
jgi:hypothetical protein